MNQIKNNIKTEFEKAFTNAEHHYQSKRYSEALQICEKILNEQKDHAPTIHLLACIYYSLNTKESLTIAKELFKKVTTLCSENAIYHNNSGLTSYVLKNFDEAILSFRKAILIKNDYADAYHNLGNTYLSLGLYNKAIENQKLAIKFNQDFLNAYLALTAAIMPGNNYMEMLKSFHNYIKPRGYLEIGVQTGKSLCIAQKPTQSIGIDPDPVIEYEFKTSTKIFSITSDSFFENYNLKSELNHAPLDMAFIDGLHLFDQSLRDFINIERNSHHDTIVLVHDCIPIDAVSSSRSRTTAFWSGDVWKLIPCLKEYRPDLKIFTILTKPTGLALIKNLDSTSTVLDKQFDLIVEQYINFSYSNIEKEWRKILNTIPNDWLYIQNLLKE